MSNTNYASGLALLSEKGRAAKVLCEQAIEDQNPRCRMVMTLILLHEMHIELCELVSKDCHLIVSAPFKNALSELTSGLALDNDSGGRVRTHAGSAVYYLKKLLIDTDHYQKHPQKRVSTT